MQTPLQTELETFERLKPDLLAEAGKFVVIHGDKVLGTYSSYEDALKIGYEKCGVSQFLVKKISAIDPVNYFTRDFQIAA